MAITIPSEDQLYQYWIQLLQAQNSTWDLSDRSFFGLLARASAQGHMLLLQAVYDADNDAVPAYAEDSDGTFLSRCSTAALDAWAVTYGLPSGTPGVYGRRGATGSSGGSGIPTCSAAGTMIPAGAQLVDATGLITVQTTATITTDGPPNDVPVSLVSITTGTQANLPANSVLTFVSPPPNVSPQLTLTVGLSGAQDIEPDSDLLARILFRLQHTPRGGTAADYRYWTEASTDSTQNNKSNNILRAYIYPQRSGTGSVDVLPLISGSGLTRIPSNGVLTAVQTYLNKVRPVTVTVNVLTPQTPNALRIQVRPQASLPKYQPDWIDGGTSTLITGHISVAKQILVAAVPLGLINAFLLGAKPRVQLIVSTANAPAVPFVARVLNIGAGVLVLDSWPPVDPTDGVDYFYAGSSIVDPIAARILSYIDSLGTSRQSGFADPDDFWDWEVSIARIIDAVVEARDTDATRLVGDILNLGTNGVEIAVGAGPFTINSYFPRDVLGSPELPFLRSGGIEVIGS